MIRYQRTVVIRTRQEPPEAPESAAPKGPPPDSPYITWPLFLLLLLTFNVVIPGLIVAFLTYLF